MDSIKKNVFNMYLYLLQWNFLLGNLHIWEGDFSSGLRDVNVTLCTWSISALLSRDVTWTVPTVGMCLLAAQDFRWLLIQVLWAVCSALLSGRCFWSVRDRSSTAALRPWLVRYLNLDVSIRASDLVQRGNMFLMLHKLDCLGLQRIEESFLIFAS